MNKDDLEKCFCSVKSATLNLCHNEINKRHLLQSSLMRWWFPGWSCGEATVRCSVSVSLRAHQSLNVELRRTDEPSDVVWERFSNVANGEPDVHTLHFEIPNTFDQSVKYIRPAVQLWKPRPWSVSTERLQNSNVGGGKEISSGTGHICIVQPDKY